MVDASPDLARILRWVQAGGEWRLLDERNDEVTISLLRCDAGEEIDRLVSRADDVRRYVADPNR